jgi:hypothetical protein
MVGSVTPYSALPTAYAAGDGVRGAGMMMGLLAAASSFAVGGMHVSEALPQEIINGACRTSHVVATDR